MSIQRIESNPRLSRSVVHNSVAWLSGVVAADCSQDIEGQTRQVLQRIDELLAASGSDKHRLLNVQIWMKDMGRDFAAMNAMWSEWLDATQTPARATAQVAFDDPEILLELIVTAAV
ncbi:MULTISPECIES: RidA family protein [unclassified Pseudomonas]|uniref:RidA family protein n=1 Tax=unclassified Pseudomonas TaxID=196821 RepID=UPI0008773885|nr:MULTISPECIES: RidA family protein [unclassified Pseudomonas]SCZ22498.1 Enamine deaminase RidA, house cleaning of reactive enamine intermediates, YjgF/YER057c/UK114 family [Pseudomonas sp. NFACC44-2]SDA51924.1 Enamine deaminase RidA, house cleaning of reactive enamine intermediates, YjgF/YER057c/UK114 family [Pseudomonas sp. NFACC51]SEJ05386.1 Enamine deaminase RidA, house cleaning of reactive enamine intermediates, YjgF/YER057c/UK114 family [Pseudomonas sp. NFACC07-1]SFH21867.1 Enamine deami